MSAESYIDSIRPKLAEQEAHNSKVEAVVGMLGRLIERHFEFDDDSDNEPLQTPSVNIRPEDPDEEVWFRLRDKNGYEIPRAQAEATADKVALVGYAQFRVFSRQTNSVAFTIAIEPPQVTGYDDQPLLAAELDGVIADLQRYEDALITQRSEQ